MCRILQKSVSNAETHERPVTVTSHETSYYSVYSYWQLLRLMLSEWHKFVENVGTSFMLLTFRHRASCI